MAPNPNKTPADDFLPKAQYEKEHDGIKQEVSRSLKEDDCMKFAVLFQKVCDEASNKVDASIQKIFVKLIKSDDELKKSLLEFISSDYAKPKMHDVICQYDKGYVKSLIKRWWLFIYTPLAIAIFELIKISIDKLFTK